jgi:hypothetical protein
MSETGATLAAFAYGEDLHGMPARSLGYRLLAPAGPEAWTSDVEALARGLHAAPYPDHWPPTELFCSVLLAGGDRLVAVARYGLVDHTPSHRRGGLELVGVIGPAGLGVSSALAVYHWLRYRRAQSDDLHGLGGCFPLADVLAKNPPQAAPAEPVPVLPIRLWQEGALLFAATAPSDPNHRLGLLEQGAASAWQWLPLVGPDFPLQTYAQRGPLVAWTPHLAGVAVKLDRKPTEDLHALRARRRVLTGVLIAALLLLGLANLVATLSQSRPVAVNNAPAPPEQRVDTPAPVGVSSAELSAERFGRALHRLLQQQGGPSGWNTGDVVRQYQRLAAQDRDLRLADPEVQEVVVALDQLSRRSTDRVETLVRKALANKGYDPRLIDLACRQVREQLNADVP